MRQIGFFGITTMIYELGTIFFASLAGSWHCAGMCGPFIGFLSKSKYQRVPLFFYHLGRLISYNFLAFLLWGMSLPIRQFFGSYFIYIILIFWVVLLLFDFKILNFKVPQAFQKKIKIIQAFGPKMRGLMLGLTTTLLPCAWLYTFLGLAVTKSTFKEVFLIIFVFWIGTIPALFGAHFIFEKIDFKTKQFSRALSLLLVLIMSLAALWLHRPGSGNENDESCPFHHEQNI